LDSTIPSHRKLHSIEDVVEDTWVVDDVVVVDVVVVDTVGPEAFHSSFDDD